MQAYIPKYIYNRAYIQHTYIYNYIHTHIHKYIHAAYLFSITHHIKNKLN